MKHSNRFLALFLVLTSAFLLTACPPQTEEEKQLYKLSKEDHKVPQYFSFEDMSGISPVPAKTQLKIRDLLRMTLLGHKKIRTSVVSPSEYNDLEKKIIQKFNDKKALRYLLKLTAYARQINAGHPYRINPFVPFFTIRNENSMFNAQKVGPAAMPVGILDQKNNFQGKVVFKKPDGMEVVIPNMSVSPNKVPESGSMLLFDHGLFDISNVLFDSKSNILEDIIIHEFTHIFHGEVTDTEHKAKYTVLSRASEAGHDAPVITNPHLGFIEGLAISAEALFGWMMVQKQTMTPQERRHFFANLKTPTDEKFAFLINRQEYVRKNAYVYNLYDFSKCTLRKVNTTDSSDIGKEADYNAILNAISNGESIEHLMDFTSNNFSFESFNDRFYGTGDLVPVSHLKKHCKFNSPSRLESSEGFIATLIYNITTRSLANQELLAMAPPSKRKVFKKDFARWIGHDHKIPTHVSWRAWLGSKRMPATSTERIAKLEKGYLLSFRELITALKNSQAGTIGEFLRYLLTSEQLRDTEKIGVAYQICKISRGRFTMNPVLREKCHTKKSAAKNKDIITEALVNLHDNHELEKIIELLNKTEQIYVEYAGKLRGGGQKVKTRININNAHHIDLIDIFGKNNKYIAAMAKKISSGITYRTPEEFIRDCTDFDSEHQCRKMLDSAKASLKENEALSENFSLASIMEPSLRYSNEPLFDSSIKIKFEETEEE
ncbi:MAG: hypothetical protein KAQ98_12525 [Bacteriovoracaceae bacterium]|nr:hypothetical protein [Bacteriovoracaceae bacterium]